MISASVQTKMNSKPLKNAVEKAAFKNFGHAAFRIRIDAQAMIKRGPTIKKKRGGKKRKRREHQASPAGSPIATSRGQAKRAIVYSATKESAIIGPRHSFVGLSFRAHELGETFHGIDYPERPTMGPALEQNLNRFASDWAGSIGE